MAGHDGIVRDGTRRIVGRAALRRAAAMVQEWQRDEAEKAALARPLFAAFVVAGLLAILYFVIR